jgi:hypothetical protein
LGAAYAGDFMDQGKQRSSSKLDCLLNQGFVQNAHFVDHDVADVLGCGGDEAGEEDVVVDAVADYAAQDSDGEGECGYLRGELVGVDWWEEDCGRELSGVRCEMGDGKVIGVFVGDMEVISPRSPVLSMQIAAEIVVRSIAKETWIEKQHTYCRNEVIRADDSRDNRGRHDDA